MSRNKSNTTISHKNNDKIRKVKQDNAAPEFFESCNQAGIDPTERQYRKWQKKTGLAYMMAQGLVNASI